MIIPHFLQCMSTIVIYILSINNNNNNKTIIGDYQNYIIKNSKI